MVSVKYVDCKYRRVLLQQGPVNYDMIYGIAMTATEHKSDFKLSRDTPYLALTGELRDVCCETAPHCMYYKLLMAMLYHILAIHTNAHTRTRTHTDTHTTHR